MKNRLIAEVFVLGMISCAGKSNAIADKTIAITFDDGPFEHTERLLAILAEYNVNATFFLVGQNVQSRPEKSRLIFEAGHEIGNHSWAFTSLGEPSPGPNAIRKSLADTSAQIRKITGTNPVFFRAPNLNYGEDLTNTAREMGMAFIGASDFSMDWEGISTEEIVSNVIDGASDGGIILLHEFSDGSRRTENALGEIIVTLRARGFDIVPVSQLAKREGLTLEAGNLYNAMK